MTLTDLKTVFDFVTLAATRRLRQCVGRGHCGHVLRNGGCFLGFHGANETITVLQPLPVSLDRRGEPRCQAKVLGQQQRVANGYICSSESPCTKIGMCRKNGLQRFKPCEEPLGVILCDYGLTSVFGLETPITQCERLWKRKRCFTEMQEVKVRAIALLVKSYLKTCRFNPATKILTDRRRLGHLGVPVNHQRDGSQRIDVHIPACHGTRWERQHLQFIGESQLFEHPKWTKGTRTHAVVQGNHDYSVGATMSNLLSSLLHLLPISRWLTVTSLHISNIDLASG